MRNHEIDSFDNLIMCQVLYVDPETSDCKVAHLSFITRYIDAQVRILLAFLVLTSRSCWFLTSFRKLRDLQKTLRINHAGFPSLS